MVKVMICGLLLDIQVIAVMNPDLDVELLNRAVFKLCKPQMKYKSLSQVDGSKVQFSLVSVNLLPIKVKPEFGNSRSLVAQALSTSLFQQALGRIRTRMLDNTW